jgi:hypothetical protein
VVSNEVTGIDHRSNVHVVSHARLVIALIEFDEQSPCPPQSMFTFWIRGNDSVQIFLQGTWQYMSAALLQDNDKCNELEDDRESCLHVLTWTALRFTKHTISGGGSNRFLRAFDEEYEDEDSVKGGDLKKGFLLGRDIPHTVKFDRRPQLDALIRGLAEAFAARYE